MKMNVKKGDLVKIIAGKDKGKEGKILRSIPQTQRVVVEGANMMKKAMRPTQQNPQGGISTMEAPLHVSNVMLVCPNCKAAESARRARKATFAFARSAVKISSNSLRNYLTGFQAGPLAR